jgi:hypothetical protein
MEHHMHNEDPTQQVPGPEDILTIAREAQGFVHLLVNHGGTTPNQRR